MGVDDLVAEATIKANNVPSLFVAAVDTLHALAEIVRASTRIFSQVCAPREGSTVTYHAEIGVDQVDASAQIAKVSDDVGDEQSAPIFLRRLVRWR